MIVAATTAACTNEVLAALSRGARKRLRVPRRIGGWAPSFEGQVDFPGGYVSPNAYRTTTPRASTERPPCERRSQYIPVGTEPASLRRTR